ncbi:MAG: dTDP-4-dehydrorhamnose reductase [Alphaproteobacteria bacterium]|nr:dTDP-4-dehydrorhamnose reductase [Alphaproteobacteria bacterium]
MFLVVGANGQLGNELRLLLQNKAEYVDREELDITDEAAVSDYVTKDKYEAIINCAAYTAVDKAEDEPELAEKINVYGPKNLAKTGVPLVHVSTDYVFNGQNYVPYKEGDETAPRSVYGVTKLAGEKAVIENASTAVVIRTAWLYSEFGNNFVKTMQRLGAERESLNVVFDQIGSPTYAKDLAQAIVEILPQLKKGTKEIYHFSNEGVCSWYDFAVEIMKKSNLSCKVFPIESSQYPTKAVRPSYSVLNKSKIKTDFGIKIRHWEEALQECINNLKG